MPNAIARGKATIPTKTPATKSVKNCLRVISLNIINNFGLNMIKPINVRNRKN
jgi:hypothetical protein